MRYQPYYGDWFNHATGVLTLTLDKFWGGILSAALVVWVALVVSLLWIPFKFIVHQSLTRPRQRFAFVEQLLVAVRNSDSAPSFGWTCLQMIRRWPGRSKLLWLLPLILLAAATFIGGTVAQLSVSLIQSSVGNEVLLVPVLCGILQWYDPRSEQTSRLYRTYSLEQTLDAQTRVTQCSAPNTDPLMCGRFAKSAIKWTGSNATCPLKHKDDCISENSTPYSMVSEFIHSSDDLGINARDEDSIIYQRRTTCSPIHLTKYASFVNANQTKYAKYNIPGTRWQLFSLGPVLHTRYSIRNETFHYSEYQPELPFPYDITAYQNEPGSTWSPDTAFWDDEDATISLVFLTPNHVVYEARVDNPWFSATYEFESIVNRHQNKTYFAPSFYVNALACTDSHRICNTNIAGDKGCTPWTASNTILSAAFNPALALNKAQLETAGRIANTIATSAIANVADGRGGSALLASRTLYGDVQVPLPLDQWRIEVGNWFSIQLALLQQRVVDYVTGPRDIRLNDLVIGPSNDILRNQCFSQRVQLPTSGYGHQNFNLIAVYIVAAVGAVLIILCHSFDSIVGFVQMRTGNWAAYQRIVWRMHGALNLLTQLDREMGGEWNDPAHEMPTSNDSVPAYDISNADNLRRRRRSDITAGGIINNAQEEERFGSQASNYKLPRLRHHDASTTTLQDAEDNAYHAYHPRPVSYLGVDDRSGTSSRSGSRARSLEYEPLPHTTSYEMGPMNRGQPPGSVSW